MLGFCRQSCKKFVKGACICLLGTLLPHSKKIWAWVGGDLARRAPCSPSASWKRLHPVCLGMRLIWLFKKVQLTNVQGLENPREKPGPLWVPWRCMLTWIRKILIPPVPVNALLSSPPAGFGHLRGRGAEHTECGTGRLPAAACGQSIGGGVWRTKVSTCTHLNSNTRTHFLPCIELSLLHHHISIFRFPPLVGAGLSSSRKSDSLPH